MWGFLHDLFRLPTPKQCHWLCDERTHAGWQLLAARFDGSVPAALPLPAGPARYEEEFLAAFEVGMPEPPCPLVESHWNCRDGVPRVLHENMLFYKQFGLRLRSSANETADHLRHQLEFLRYLALLAEGVSPEETDRAAQIEQARNDFLARHTGLWVPLAARVIDERLPGSWAADWMRLLAACCERSREDG